MRLAKNIAELRKKAGLTQEKLAEKCDVSRQAVTKWESGESEPSIDKLVVLAKVFEISVDVLISGEVNQIVTSKLPNIDYGDLELFIRMLSEAKGLDSDNGGKLKNKLLRILFEQLKTKYIDENGKTKDEFLIANTQKRDREVKVVFISRFFDDKNNPFMDYILGNREISEILLCIDEELNKNQENIRDILDEKRDTDIIRLFLRYSALISIDDFDTYKEDDFDGITGQLYDRVGKLSGNTLVERLMAFWAKEIETAFSNKDVKLLRELHCDLPIWREYFWYKA